MMLVFWWLQVLCIVVFEELKLFKVFMKPFFFRLNWVLLIVKALFPLRTFCPVANLKYVLSRCNSHAWHNFLHFLYDKNRYNKIEWNWVICFFIVLRRFENFFHFLQKLFRLKTTLPILKKKRLSLERLPSLLCLKF